MLRSPRAVPTLPRGRCPSPLTPGCREPVQFHHDPPGSFGTCMWYRYPTPNRKHKAAAGAPGRMSAPGAGNRLAVTWALPAGPPGLGGLARKVNALQRVRLKLMRHRTAAGISCSSSASLSPGQHNTLRQRSSQAPALALPTPSQGSNGTAQLPLPLQWLSP